MTIKDQLMEDMKTAMKAHDSVTLDAIRFLRAEIKNFEIDNGDQDDTGVLKLIQRQIKQMKDAIAEYAKGGRQDLVDAETAKMNVLEKYLPQQLSDEALSQIIDDVLGANAGANMGAVIGQVMKRVEGQADGGRVSAMIKAKMMPA